MRSADRRIEKQRTKYGSQLIIICVVQTVYVLFIAPTYYSHRQKQYVPRLHYIAFRIVWSACRGPELRDITSRSQMASLCFGCWFVCVLAGELGAREQLKH